MIDTDAETLDEAAAWEFVALRGDVPTEALLRAACVLVAPEVWLVAPAREGENIKPLYRTGRILSSPPSSGGRLIGAAEADRHAADLPDLALQAGDRIVSLCADKTRRGWQEESAGAGRSSERR